ncbi:MAG: DHH family phosphoesterase [Oscillospiraceae bacterium]|nr:DHH family phosphoesterase [Oscillospiraceae bacterium]
MRSNNQLKIREKIEDKARVYLVIIAVIMIALCINNRVFIIPSLILYILIIFYTIWSSNRRRGELSTYIEELTIRVDSAAKNTLINSPFPIIVLETDGNVIWRSSNFNKEFANIGINTYIDEIAKVIKVELGEDADSKFDRKMEIGDKTYRLIGNGVKIRQKDKKKTSKYMTILYFIDITREQELFKKYVDSQTCVGIVSIDNAEETIQRIATEEKPQVLASIEKELYEWASKTSGVMIKTERDAYVYVFEQEHLEELKEEKFSILDKVKEIKTEDKIQITLSIAISNEGETNYEKYESALACMDIALGRGGDQAVLRQDDKYHFFGGRAQEVEKRTRVKARIIAHALEELIAEASNVMIMGHNNGDIDSFGSSLGLYRLAKTFEKDVYIVNNTYGLTLESFIKSLEKKEEYEDVVIDKHKALSEINENTLLIIADTHKKTYVEAPELLEKTEKIVVIDHHRKSADFIENAILSFHEAYASSTAELVTEIIEYASKDVVLEKIEAEGLYAGIMVDTKNFTFKTGVRTFEAAAYLRKYGIDIIEIKKWFQSDLESYNLIADIVKRAEIVNDTIGISEYSEKDKNANIICAKAADELLTISNITASFVFGNLGDKICISGRSIGDINVQVILEKLRRRRTYYFSRSTTRRNDNGRS